MFFRLILPTVAVLGLGVSAAQAEVVKLHGRFIVEHGATTTPEGGVSAKLDTVKDTLIYKVHYKGLSGDVNAVHLHGPADESQEAGVMAPMTGPYTGHLRGTLHLTADQVKDVEAGKSYVNLHTEKFPEGEARAQLVH